MLVRKALIALLGTTLLILGLIALLYSYYTLNRSNDNTGLNQVEVQEVRNLIKIETASPSAMPTLTATPSPTKRPIPVNQGNLQISPSPTL